MQDTTLKIRGALAQAQIRIQEAEAAFDDAWNEHSRCQSRRTRQAVTAAHSVAMQAHEDYKRLQQVKLQHDARMVLSSDTANIRRNLENELQQAQQQKLTLETANFIKFLQRKLAFYNSNQYQQYKDANR